MAELKEDAGETLDLDLLEEDPKLREAIAKPTRVKLPTGEIITIPHALDWDINANRLMAAEFWNAWAELVLSEEDYKKWIEAKLRIYQSNRIIETLNAAHGITAGKQQRSSSSQRSTAPR